MKQEIRKMYPLLFEPIYRKALWGGDKLCTRLNRNLPATLIPYSESWEISDRDDATSIVENGDLKGATLRELMHNYRLLLIGNKCCEKRFPIMIRFVDAKRRLSLQVHPNKVSAINLLGSEPKDELWYIIAAEHSAQIYAGLKERINSENFIKECGSPEIDRYIEVTNSAPGDAYYISAGTMHAIGAGNFLLEICQNSNTTFRVNDWGRVDQQGNPRQLHLEEAKKCAKMTPEIKAPKILKKMIQEGHNQRYALENAKGIFNVDELRLVRPWSDRTNGQSCHILTSINKPMKVSNHESSTDVAAGRSCLIPAAYGAYQIDIQEEDTIIIKTYF